MACESAGAPSMGTGRAICTAEEGVPDPTWSGYRPPDATAPGARRAVGLRPPRGRRAQTREVGEGPQLAARSVTPVLLSRLPSLRVSRTRAEVNEPCVEILGDDPLSGDTLGLGRGEEHHRRAHDFGGEQRPARLMRLPRLPIELASAVPALDSLTPIRRELPPGRRDRRCRPRIPPPPGPGSG